MMMDPHISPRLTRLRLFTDEALPRLDVPTMSLKKAGMHYFQPSFSKTLTDARIYERVWMH